MKFVVQADREPRSVSMCVVHGRDHHGNPVSETLEIDNWYPSTRKVRRAFRSGQGRAARREHAAYGFYGRARSTTLRQQITKFSYFGAVEVVFCTVEVDSNIPVTLGVSDVL